MTQGSLYGAILPYIDGGSYYNEAVSATSVHQVKVFVSPADPTVRVFLGNSSNCSYAANAQGFKVRESLTRSFPDGTSNTIAFAEHYTLCREVSFSWTISEPLPFDVRRATFADNEIIDPELGYFSMGDVYPVTSGNPPVSVGNLFEDVTFQVRPATTGTACWPSIAQTPHAGGMLIALFDGSVRTIAPGVSPAVYWGAVTPDGGENLGEW